MSAIKKTLINDDYPWDNDRILLTTLTKACRLENDRVKTRLPIQGGLLELVLFEINRMLSTQHYLSLMYTALFALGYYGLFRVGELFKTHDDVDHTIKARNVHVATNKEKILVILYSSKTHGLDQNPQRIKITAEKDQNKKLHRNFCPFKIMQRYIELRGGYREDNDQLFIFSDGSPVTAAAARIC